jgi:AAA domain, putative AbiEii toxin, Type IV TA system
MHLLEIFIEEFRSIRKQRLPANGMVVLFGVNSAGKTSVLEAVVELLTAASSRRIDPGESEDEDQPSKGAIWFTLPDAGISGSPGAELYAALLTGEHADGRAWEELGPDAAGVLRGKTAGDAREWIASRFVEAGRAGLLADREILARSVLDPAAAYFGADSDDVGMYAHASRLAGDVIGAAHRIAADTDHDGVLWRIADRLATGQSALIGLVAGRDAISDAFPPVIVLDGDPGALSAELVKALPVIHNRLWYSHDPGFAPNWFHRGALVIDSDIPPDLSDWFGGFSTLSFSEPAPDRYFIDDWLEQRSDSAAAEAAVNYEAYGQAAVWSRVRQSIHATAAAIAQEANRVAPGFLRHQGQIGVEVLPVSVWGPEDRRIRVTFTATGRDRWHRDLRVVGAGTARWAAAAVQLACRNMEKGTQVVTDQDGSVIGERDAVRDMVAAARAEPLSQSTVRLESADAPGVYVIDEPEAHLHPAAIASVRAWLEELARTATAVLAATHSPMLLDTDSHLTKRILVRPGDGETELQNLTGITDDRLTEAASELGITKGDLLLMTRLAVFVEGPHDVIILGEWFGNELRAAGIRVFPAHGGDNFEELVTTQPGVVGSEIIDALGIRIAVISDRSPNRVEPAVNRLLREAEQAGREVISVNLSKEDILFYLDEQVCRNDAPDFPGWHAAQDAYRAAPRRDRKDRTWKKWVSETYRLELSLENVRRLAAECKRQGRIPAELIQEIKQLTALAASTEKRRPNRDRRPGRGRPAAGT